MATEGAGLGFPLEAMAKIEAVRGAGRRSLEIFARAGVRMAYGSDLLGETQRLQSDEFTLRAAVLGAPEAIRAATTHAAFLLNRQGQLGTVAAGAIADLLLVDGNPLDNIHLLRGQGESLLVTMKDGRILKNLTQGEPRDSDAP